MQGETARIAAEKIAQLEEAWKKIHVATLASLVASMCCRCKAVMKSKG